MDQRPRTVRPAVARRRRGGRPGDRPRRRRSAHRRIAAAGDPPRRRRAIACYLDAAADPQHPQGIWRDRLFSTRYACPPLQHQSGGVRTADVQLQQSLRGLPAVRRLGSPGAVRSGIGGAGRGSLSLSRRRGRAVEGLDGCHGPQARQVKRGLLEAQGADADTPLDQLDPNGRSMPCCTATGKKVCRRVDDAGEAVRHRDARGAARRGWPASGDWFSARMPRLAAAAGSQFRPRRRRNIYEICRLAVSEAEEFFATLQVPEIASGRSPIRWSPRSASGWSS
jgi:hypothetical protein